MVAGPDRLRFPAANYQITLTLPKREKTGMEREKGRISSYCFLFEQQGVIYNTVRFVVARQQCPFPAARASLATTASQQPAAFYCLGELNPVSRVVNENQQRMRFAVAAVLQDPSAKAEAPRNS